MAYETERERSTKNRINAIREREKRLLGAVRPQYDAARAERVEEQFYILNVKLDILLDLAASDL